MRHITIPRDVSSDTQRAIQQINLALQHLDIPLLNDFKSVQGIAEGTSAYFLEGDALYRWTKMGGKLYKEKVEVLELPAEASTVDVLRQVGVAPGAPKKVVVNYRRVANAPRAVSFDAEWYRLDSSQQPVEVPMAERPTDVIFNPAEPANSAGDHYVEVTFTPQSFEDPIIGRVLVREAGDA